MIKATNLKKQYGQLVAVDGLGFEIKRGETFGLLGPNGAGKSTTINMLIGLLAPDEGEVVIGNDGVDDGAPTNPSVRRRIGISPQSLSLYEELSAKENLDFFGGLYGLSGNSLRERTKWSLDFSGLEERKNDRVATFSGGMKRRLNIAAAMMHSPEILLLDEPTVGVDPQSRNYIFDSIEQLKESGLTVIYTTHYMEEAQRLCDRVAIVDKGILLALDTVNQLILDYGGMSGVTAEVAGFDKGKIETDLIAEFEVDGNEIQFFSARPFEAIDWLKNEQGIRFESLNLSRPNLESVFLSLTGRSLRD